MLLSTGTASSNGALPEEQGGAGKSRGCQTGMLILGVGWGWTDDSPACLHE